MIIEKNYKRNINGKIIRREIVEVKCDQCGKQWNAIYYTRINKVLDADLCKSCRAKLKKAQEATKRNPETIKNLQTKLKKLKAKKILKIELKNISLGTSKTNYIDPRIGVAFMKKHKLPIDKIFTKTLQEKFKWAMNIENDFVF